MSEGERRALVWFRADLRTRDNPALTEAVRRGADGVIAVFAICPEQWREHDWGAVRVDFLLRNLKALSDALAERGIPLRLVREPSFKQVPDALLNLARHHGCQSLLYNREYEVNERRRDAQVRRCFEADGRQVESFHDQVVFPPDAIRTGDGEFYKVFTPYSKRWRQRLEDEGPPQLHRRPHRSDLPESPQPSHIPERLQDWTGLSRPDLWPAGEDEAEQRLRRFVSRRIEGYAEDRDYPARAATSALSPYLTHGVLSVRQCLVEALDAREGTRGKAREGVDTWISELIWREFYRHVLVGFPRVSMHQPFDPKGADVRWRDDDAAFERWAEGRTGYPIIDAGMRQLAQTGWMHNRVRMLTAMFLAKNLLIDWRRGERHFMRHLVDGDLASNNGGWQWAASTGTDAAPYFRIFNPVTQSERFDPEGRYIRRFVPELSDLDGKPIHDPGHRLDAEARAALDYPEPLVDLSSTRERAIEAFKARD